MQFILSSHVNISFNKNDEYNKKIYRKKLHDRASKQYKKLLKNLEKAEKHRKYHELQQTK
jgi:hypothetical protein|tara:strand:- start:1900 stop:2079 length:180 start_codon:yes stop_codon:yes gene_type:complete